MQKRFTGQQTMARPSNCPSFIKGASVDDVRSETSQFVSGTAPPAVPHFDTLRLVFFLFRGLVMSLCNSYDIGLFVGMLSAG